MYEELAEFYDRSIDIGPLDSLVDAYVSPFRGGAALDLGCGTGLSTELLIKRGLSAVGIDNSANMLRWARERCKTAQFQLGDMADFAFPRKFDVCVCLNRTISYLPNLERVRSMFSAVRNHLKPGGLFLFDIYPSQVHEVAEEAGSTLLITKEHALPESRWRTDLVIVRRVDGNVQIAKETHIQWLPRRDCYEAELTALDFARVSACRFDVPESDASIEVICALR
jgi:SAM-dependent methyltransferase